jgi:hypothetical protein
VGGTFTTRAMLREMVRRRLADTSAEPLWENDLLDDAIAEAVRRYGERFPREATATISVTSGARSLTIPAAVNPGRIVRLCDERGDIWQRWTESLAVDPPVADAVATGHRVWRVWGNAIVLASPAPRDGFWKLEHLAARAIVDDDVTPMDFEIGDDDIHIAVAMHVALMRRAIADGKRMVGSGSGSKHPLMLAAQMAQADASQLIWLRRRRVHGGTLASSEVAR